MPLSPLIRDLGPQDADYLRDESRLIGQAKSISFPASEAEVREVLRRTSDAGIPVTVQGGRTGITGGAVPRGGHVLKLGRMDRLLDLRLDPGRGLWLLRVQPGLPPAALNAALDAAAASGMPPGLPPLPPDDRAALAASGALFFPPTRRKAPPPWEAWPAPMPPAPAPWPTVPPGSTWKPCGWRWPTARLCR